MKRITVGRGNDCDIVIIDETDNVSRHHLVITFNFLGKMKVSDTSSNGTFINGIRMLKGTSIPVTTMDKIRLGINKDLDWSLVKDPYRSIRIALVSMLSVLIVCAIGIWSWNWYKELHAPADNNKIVLPAPDIELDDNWNKDSTAKVAPTVTSIEVKESKKFPSKPINRKNKNTKKVINLKEKAGSHIENSNELDSIAVL